jgi:pseudouridylate synthase I
MIRVAIKIAYLGDDFYGSQIQPDMKTVEGDVLSDLMKICDIEEDAIDLRLASRTDRGVNALGNVAVLNSDINDPDILLKALNSVSKSIFYRSFAVVDETFNPRHAALRKYKYITPSKGLDIERMRSCAQLFVGEHDFVRFCRSEGKPTTITIDDISVTADEHLVTLDFSARYYLWNMVRRISAALISVGRGDSEIADVRSALEGQDLTFGLARADALTLTDIAYPNLDFIIPSKNMMVQRIDEENFRICMKNRFFESL